MASDCGLHDLRDMGVSARHAITFLYTGSCTLASHDELVPLLHTAKRLDMPVLFDAVAATIGRHLTADSCVGAWTLGVELDAPVLIAAAHALCEKEFETLAHGDIGGLTHAAMAALLSSSNLVVEEEKRVFQALEVWWRAQRVPPTPEAVAELVHSVRFPQRLHLAACAAGSYHAVPCRKRRTLRCHARVSAPRQSLLGARPDLQQGSVLLYGVQVASKLVTTVLRPTLAHCSSKERR